MVQDTNRSDTAVNASIPSDRTHVIPRLIAISGPGAGRAFALTRATATAGRHPTNDLVVDDERVSGVHLELRRVQDRIEVRDAGSTNGTWLAGQRIRSAELGARAEIRIGDTVLRVETEDSAVPATTSTEHTFGELVGTSTAMREIFATLDRVARKPLSILFEGEAGTGKEEMARAVVARSPRAAGPFIILDVASLAPAVVDSVLFGQEGTSAEASRPGVFETANGGTALLTEVGLLPDATQARLLRLLERQELTRSGGHLSLRADVRVLGASTRDLRHEVDAGRFREDLYARLAQVRIAIPALRDRLEDIPVLCGKLLATAPGDELRGIAEDALLQLARHPWPGNVRELRNALLRAYALAPDGVIRSADVAGEGFGFRGTRDERSALDLSGPFKTAKDRAIERFEAAYLAALMRRCSGNVSQASREADLARHHLRELLKKRALYGIAWDKEQD